MDDRLLKLNFNDTLLAASDLILPRVCVVCGRPLTLCERHLCLRCETDLPLTHFSSLADNPMARAYNSMIGRELTRFEPFQDACALLYYRDGSGFNSIPQAVKYRRNFSAGRRFGKMMGEDLASSLLFLDVDMVIPVPLHWTRRWKRGYNQAEILAREVASVLGARMEPHLLQRCRPTKTQTRLSATEKKRNVADAFRVRASRARKLSGIRHILIVDDVFTTGSTAAACHKALRAAFGAEIRISCATLSFVG